MTRKLKVVTGTGLTRSVNRDGNRPRRNAPSSRSLAALPVAKKCLLCAKNVAEMEISLGPVFARVCKPCAMPLWHVMGLADWVKRVGDKLKK